MLFHPFLKPEHTVKTVVIVIIVDFACFRIVGIGTETVEEFHGVPASFHPYCSAERRKRQMCGTFF